MILILDIFFERPDKMIVSFIIVEGVNNLVIVSALNLLKT